MLLWGLILVFVVPISAQVIIEEVTDSVAIDSLVIDSVESDPEWYVAPEMRFSFRAPMRTSANACLLDSILTYDIDSVLISVTVYEYGDTTCTSVWSIQSDGSRTGVSKEESASSSTATFYASYTWDDATNNWAGIYKEEHTYAADKETERILYNTWLNDAWVADTKYTWSYNEADVETEYTTYTRNTSTNELVLSKQRIREYNAKNQKTLEILYTAHNGTSWTAGTKKVYDYDAAGNQIEYTYCASYSNGAWINSTHENWTYNEDNLKTYYKKETWSSGAWVTSNEEFYDYYNAKGAYLLIEKYALKSGVLAGSQKQVYAYNALGLQTSLIAYTWKNGAWLESTWTVTGYDNAQNKIETCKYAWKNDTWTGTGKRELKTYNAKKKVTEHITQTWPSGATDWVNSTRLTYAYNAKYVKTQEVSYKWQDEEWKGVYLIDWRFNTAGKNDSILVYTPNGTDWDYSTRTLFEYNAKGDTTLARYEDWNGTQWAMASIRRFDILYSGSHVVSNAAYKCMQDSVWFGVSKDSAAYSATGKEVFTGSYKWSNNAWTLSTYTANTYDAADSLILSEKFTWQGSTKVGNYRYEKNYDALGNEILNASYTSWNKNAGTWIGNRKLERIYENGHESSLTIYTWGTTDWVPENRFNYTYDAAGNEIVQMVETYTNGTWVNSKKYEKEYIGETQVKDNTFTWLNNQWVFTLRNEFYYDADDQMKLRSQITGSWDTNCELIVYTDNSYAYACDPRMVRFVNYDGTVLETQTVAQGVMPVYTGTTPTREGSADYTYTFAGWEPEIVPVSAHVTYTATYTATKNSFTITWLNENGEEIDQTTVNYGVMPTHANPAKESSAEYDYTFGGWTPGLGIATSDATYQAIFTPIKRHYTITWLDEDGSFIDQTAVEYGEVPTHADPTKTATAEFTYTFAGWDNEPVAVTGEASYKATYSATKNSYTITWLDDDNSSLGTSIIEYGELPTHADPTKAATAEFTYTFAGWDDEPVAVTGEASYEATYSATKNSYTITWLDDDNSSLGTSIVEYGEVPTHDDPTKQPTAQYGYTFAGWNPAVIAVTNNATYKATYTDTINQYTISWLDDADNLVDQTQVAYGSTPAHAYIYKESDDQYDYTFAGWTPTIEPVRGEANYSAVFQSAIRSYTVTFYFEDGVTILEQMTLEYGESPSTSYIPSMPSDEYHTYTFAGWSPEIAPITGDVSYTPTFTAIPNQYMITFRNYNGKDLQSSKWDYDVIPEYTGEIPTRNGNAQYSYVFAGWEPELSPVREEAVYKAVFEKITNTFIVIFYDEDGITELDQTEVEYGKVPSTSVVPVKEEDEEYIYTFTGWQPKLTKATKDTSYKASYKATHRTQDMHSAETGESVTKVMIDNQIFIRRGGTTYTIDGIKVKQKN